MKSSPSGDLHKLEAVFSERCIRGTLEVPPLIIKNHTARRPIEPDYES